MSSSPHWKLPPKIKVLEALGAIADGRVKLTEDGAIVVSSDGSRSYRVTYHGGDVINSTDNGSVYRGYLGYPSIAVLMLRGVLPFDREIAEALKGIPWRQLNEQYKKYSIVEEIVLKEAERRGVPAEKIKAFVERVMEEIRKRKFRRPQYVQKTLF